MTAVVVDVVDTLEETYVAFKVVGISTARVIVILKSFYLDAAFNEWELSNSFPTRVLRAQDGEICYRILRG